MTRSERMLKTPNTPGIPRGNAKGLINKTYRTDRGVSTATVTILSEPKTENEMPFLRGSKSGDIDLTDQGESGALEERDRAQVGEGFSSIHLAANSSPARLPKQDWNLAGNGYRKQFELIKMC